MGIKKERIENTWRFSIDGELTQERALDLYEQMIQCINKGETQIELDLEKCDFVSSSGLGSIAAVTMVARSRKGDLTILKCHENVKNLLSITKLDQIIEIK